MKIPSKVSEKLDEIFLHEVLHRINDVYNTEKLNEETIIRISEGLMQVLKDNKLFREKNRKEGGDVDY